MTVAGTVATLRVTGVPSGYPAEQESNIKVRFIDTALEVMSDYDTPLLKRLGGVSQFVGNNTKIEWVLADTWSDRGTISGSHSDVTTTLTLSAAIAHRFPRGAVLKIEDEYVWVSAQATTTTLTVVRDYAGSTGAAHASATEFRLVGFTEVEGTSFVFRGSALRSVPYNYFTIYKGGMSESWMQTEANVYTRAGSTMGETMADTVMQVAVAMEGQILEGQRYEGTGANDPPWTGGLRFFCTSVNGATVIDCGGAKLSRALLNQGFDSAFEQVGLSQMARTVIGGVGVGRTLYREFKQDQVRTTPGDSTHVEMFTTLQNEYGRVEFLGPYKRVADGEAWAINPALLKIGTFGTLGRLHQGSIATNGDFNAQYWYGAYGNMVKGIPGMIRWHNFTTD